MGTTVEQIMSWHVITVELDATLDTVVHLMGAYDYESFPIVDRQNRVRASLRGTTSSGRWPATLGARRRPYLYWLFHCVGLPATVLPRARYASIRRRCAHRFWP
ncbi:CBS domain-containing protein [Bradyrhizobium sp.]|uniref:CBS domain-containing protein n=1 Tax=Bradyrhizobium sp. TaxID=376 RepID=UPI003C6EBDC2